MTAAKYVLDASHSHVQFSVRHMMITNVRGEFTDVSATASYDPANPSALSVEATLQVASINTRDEKRDGHLKSADFFDVEKFPTITFKSQRAEKKGGGFVVTGDLTIHGTTRSVDLSVEDVTAEHKDPWGNTRIGAVGKTKVKRSDFGMTWNSAIEAGGVLVGDDVTITIEAELIRQA
jgi:polyisoprenoid-binding protein YceI